MPQMKEAVLKTNETRKKKLGRKSSDAGRKRRTALKISRAERQEECKAYVEAQAIIHTYGSDDSGSSDEEEGNAPSASTTENSATKRCRCGSTTHRRTSHRDCPLKKRNA